jgi:hypothetical protein
MADITNPEAILFSNEVIRPLAEKMRGLKAEIDAATVQWFGGLDAVITGGDTLQDGREDEGVSRLTGSDIVNLITQMITYQTQLDQAGVDNIVQKPCVRTLGVTI